MFHLFNRVYIENKKWYTTSHEHLILYSKESNHPISEITEIEIDKVPGFDDYLKLKHDGELDAFWVSLIGIPVDKKFIIFTDQDLHDRLQVQYWKSIFYLTSAEQCYRLYKLYYLDKRLKLFTSMTPSSFLRPDLDKKILLEEESFLKLFHTEPVINSLLAMDKTTVSFEYLLANYFLASTGKYAAAFLQKLEDLSWKAFFDNIDILRSEILNSMYDVQKIFPEAILDFEDIESVENFISSEPKLKWIADPLFHSRDRAHVLKNYTKDNFLDITMAMGRCWVSNSGFSDREFDKILESEDHIQLIKCTFDGRFKELLEMSLAKKFGCVFVSDDLNNKANQILPLFIYDKVRSNQVGELEFLRLI